MTRIEELSHKQNVQIQFFIAEYYKTKKNLLVKVALLNHFRCCELNPGLSGESRVS